MNGIFCSSTATTNEEYKKVIKARMTRMLFVFGIGCLTLAVSIWANASKKANLSDQMLGVYTGVGVGLILVSILLFIKNILILRNEEKLKNSRLENADERIHEIGNKAFRVAGFSLLVAIYAVGLIGGIFYPILINVLFGLVSLFLLVYFIAYKIYDKSM